MKDAEISLHKRIWGAAFGFAALLVVLLGPWAERAAAGPCDPPANEIVCENSKPGSPPEEWDVSGAGDLSIQGFATQISVDHGETVNFKIDTDATAYRIDIYRMGYYGGDGARKVATVGPSAELPQEQPPCDEEPSTGLVDCGNWSASASWPVPANAVSGIYFAKLVREDQSSEGSHVYFVVRDDEGHSDLLFQTSDTTWQAYNSYGGNSLYEGGPGTNPNRAYAVSYNRPITVRGETPENAPFNAEYPMVRWLERNGYDVSYFSGVDADRDGAEMLEHKAYLSVGHDEYWSAQQRANVEAAREAGVDLAFFSGNEVFWKTRWEDSIDGSGTDHRTLVSYKETHANAKIDPESNVWTGTWRDPRFSPPADGGRPENALTGTIFTVNSGTAAIEVPAEDAKLRFWRHTSVASLQSGETVTFPQGTLGYEWDEDQDNGFRPPGLADLSSTTVQVPQKLLDYGSNYDAGTATHNLTLYRAPSGALVFGAGTVQWSWGLDENHDRGNLAPDQDIQQATVNLFADMGVQPQQLQGDLTSATQSNDSTPPVTTIGSPSDGSQIENGKTVTISGTATDAAGEIAGGQVAGVEVSTDGGGTWHPAKGHDAWSYSWKPTTLGEATIVTRAVDDSGNLESEGDQVSVDVVPRTCPCSIWDDSLSGPQDPDSNSVEVGVKFSSSVDGFVTGLRFYKTTDNTGTHVGRIWTAAGTELAKATFTGESAGGWQDVTFDSPVAVKAGTTYLASYHAPNGHYASLPNYFTLVGVDSGPLHALADGTAGGNGVFNYGPAGNLFAGGGPESFGATNYLVDVVFESQAVADTTPPTVNGQTPAGGSTDVSTRVTLGATFSEAMNPATISSATVELRSSGGTLVPATISYDATNRRVTIDPNAGLAHGTTYTVTAKSGPSGVKDLAGNPLAADASWSFTTAPAAPPPPGDGPGGPILVISNPANPFSRYYTEILRTEGLNEFTAKDLGDVTPAVLGSYDIAILGEGSLSAGQAEMLSNWVQAGGNLIAMRPASNLAGLLGIEAAGGSLSNQYLKINTATAPGAGLVNQTIQFHGTADRYVSKGAEVLATLYSDASTATANPAVTLRSVGSNGGQAAAFSYDLAKSVVYTRQGNPAWAGEERDGVGPTRSDDLFFGNKAGDPQEDWVNLNKVAIPQADEQQRLLTNLIERMNRDRKPLPRFWFLPRDEKAAVVMTGDDHGNGGTAGRFEEYEHDSPPGCVVADWQCVRSTSYIYPSTPLSDGRAAEFVANGFEIGLHTLTDCLDWGSQGQLEEFFSSQLDTLAGNFPSLPEPRTNRTHCIVWSDWATEPKVELENGMRLDTNYYYWPGSWVQNRPGMFTGSGMPMRFADLDGSMIDVYQAATQMTDESGQEFPFTIDTLLDNALGANGYYGVFTANMHTDTAFSPGSDAIVSSALAHEVPIVSARQMLTWLDGRNQSSFGSVAWAGNQLTFTINHAVGANGLRAMLPVSSAGGDLAAVKLNGSTVATTVRTIKGMEYAFFDAGSGSYTAIYGGAPTGTIPPSPANANSPKLVGSAPAGSFVRVYKGANCSGSSVASGTAAQFATGITVSVADNSVTEFRVTSTPEGGSAGPCSAPVTYEEDSSSPNTQITKAPASVSSGSVAFEFSGTDTGSGVASFECRRDSSEASAWASCSSPKTYEGLTNGSHKFEVRAVDKAGNVDSSPAITSWTVDATAPTVTFDSVSPSLLAAGGSSSIHWHANENGSFALQVGGSDCTTGTVVDSGTYSTQPAQRTSIVNASALSEGANTLRLCVTDAVANQGSSTTTITLDTTAPTAQVSKAPASFVATGSAAFEFTGSDGSGSGVASFQCRRDSSLPGDWAPCTSPKSYTGLADGSHNFEVRAIDKAGNTGNPVSATWTVDTTVPTAQIIKAPVSLVATGSAAFEFTGNDGSGSGIASFECRRDSSETSAWESCSSPKEYSALSDGSHSFEVRAIDHAGNTGNAAAATWTVDTAAPTVQVTKAPASLISSATAQFEFTGSDGSGSGVASFQCRRDSNQPGDWTSCSSPKTYEGLADGDHTFEVRPIDKAGNTGNAATATWTVDTTAPTAQITKAPVTLIVSGSAAFEFTGSDGSGSDIASFECRRDSNEPSAWAPCTSPKTYEGLADGPHKFEVRAIDNAGNTGNAAAATWTVDTTAPTAQVTKAPPSLVSTGNAAFEFTGTDTGGSGVASFQCRRDSNQPADWAPCFSPKEYSALSDGSHTFEVRAIDHAGNTGNAASATWTIDTTAPTVQVTKAPAALVSSATAQLEFTGSDGSGSGVASFECRRDSNQPGDWAPCSSPKSYSALSDGSHSFEVRAIDNAGNTGNAAAATWTVDTTAPTAQVTKAPATLVASGNAAFEFTGTDTGGSGVASFECRRDSNQPADWAPCASPKTYTGLSDGSHSFEVRAIDHAGNTGNAAAATWTVDTTAPTAQVTKAPASLVSSAAAQLEFTGSDGPGSGIASFECRRDSNQPGDWAACTSPKSYEGLSDGSHSFEVRAIDNAGNTGNPASAGWTVDTAAPTAQITKAPASLVSSSNAAFEFTGNDGSGSGVASFECRRDSTQPADWAPCSSPREYAGLADGSHSFEVRAIDKAGNTGNAASTTWTVDTTAPTVQIIKAPASLVATGSAAFEFTGSDSSGSGVASFQCRRDSSEVSAWAPCTSPKTYEGLADGSHTFAVRAIDKAGNTGNAASATWAVDTTTPTAQVTKAPTSLVASGNAAFEFIGNDTGGSGVASFQCRRDSTEPSAWASCASPKTYEGLADGSHKFEVRAIDNAGNTGNAATATWTVDTTAPTAQITKAPTSLIAISSATFEFTGNDGSGSGIASFECRRDSTQPGDWQACTSPKEYSALSDGSHTFEVRAIDHAGNTGNAASATWTVDTTAPTVQVTKAPASLISSATAQLEFTGSDGSGSGVASFECRRDSNQPGDWTSCSSPKTYEGLADGDHTFEVRAIDHAGNTGNAATATWTVDTTAPTVQIIKAPASLVASGNATFEFTGNDGPGSGIASFQCRRDSSQPGDWQPCSSPKEYTALSDGSHTFEVRAIDHAGNTGNAATATWTTDTAAPTAQVTKAPASLVATGSAAFEFTGNDGTGSGVASFECRRDSSEASAWAPCASPKTYTGLSDGSHSFEVRAIDNAGNAGNAAAATWTVDTTAPTAQVTKAPASLVATGSAAFEFTGSDTGGSGVASFQCRRDSTQPADWAPCTSPKSYEGLADGPHKFEVRAIDNAGNTGNAAAVTWTVDTAAPTAQITKAPASLVSSAAAQLEFTGSDGSGSGIASFECRRDSNEPSAWAPCTSPKTYTGLSDGSHTFEVRAIDNAANVGNAAAVTWTVDTAAPTAQITKAPASLVSSATAQFEFIGNDGSGSGVASFQCRRDSSQPGDWVPCSSPREYTALSDGSHTVEVRAIDNAGNVGNLAIATWVVDTTAPTAQVTKAPASPVSSSSAAFEFTGSDGSGSGIASFQCRRDSTQPGDWTSCTSPKSYEGLADGPHKFEVRAIDNAGNTGNAASATWTVDTTAPTVQVTKAPASLISSATAQFEFTGSDGSGSGVASFQCRRDSNQPGDWTSCSSPKTYEGLADGDHTFEVRPIDKAGNTGNAATATWTVDTTAPTAQITKAPVTLIVSGSAAFEFTGSDGSGSDIASFECRRDSNEPSAWAPCTSPKTYEGLADGPHKFEVRAIDNAGNTGNAAAATWTVDTTAPTAQVTKAPPSLVSTGNAAFEFTGTDTGGSGVASFQCRRDSNQPADWAPCFSPKEYSALSDGSHTFEVRAIDHAGNTGNAAAATWTVDTTVPTAQVTKAPASLVSSATAQFEFIGNDGPGSGIASFQCRRDSTQPADWAPCTSPKSYEGLSDGPHKFEVRAIDNAGNTGNAAPATWTVDTNPPLVTIDSGPSATTNNPSPTFTFHSSEPGSSFECSIDSGTPAYGPCSGPGASHTPASPLGDGSYTFRVRATDAASNLGAAATRSFTVDTVAPLAPELSATVPVSPSSDNSPTITGFAPAGSTVRLYASDDCSGSAIATVAATQLATGIPVSVSDDSTTEFSATATSSAENLSPCSTPITYIEDSSSPETSIDGHPVDPTNQSTGTFVFSATDLGGSGIASFQCRRDSSQEVDWTPCSSPKTYEGIADGSHKFEVRAVDKAGNVDTSAAISSWTVDATAPTVAFDSLSPNLVGAGGSSSVHWHANENGSFQLRVGGSDCTSGTVIDSGTYSSQPAQRTSIVNASALSEGANTLRLCVTDAVTNRGSATATVTLDATAPTTQITKAPASLVSSSTAQLEFTGSDGSGSGIASFECRRDSTEPPAWSPCSSPKTYEGLADGPHKFEVRAVDNAGNVGNAVTATWTVDTTVPTVQITKAPASIAATGSAAFEFTGSDGSGSGVASFECRRDSAEPSAWAPCTSPKEYAGLADGPHKFEVKAIDHAGNTGNAASATWTVDTTAPTAQVTKAPTSLVASGNAAFEFIGSDGTGSGIASYECRRDSSQKADWQPCSSPKEYAGLSDGSHTFEVRAIDNAGNIGNAASAAWTVDTAAPSVMIDSLSTSLLGAGASAEVHWHANENGSFQLRVGGSDCTSGTVIDSGTYSSQPAQRTSTVSVADLSEGANALRLCVSDAASNRGSTSFTLNRDSIAPETQIDSGPSTLSASAAASFAFSGSDSGGSGIASFECRRDSSESAAWQPCPSPKSYAALADGPHSFQVRAIDVAGNRDGSPATFSWTVDTTPPVATIDSGPGGLTNNSTPTFTFHSSEPGSSFECSIDSGTPAYGPCSGANSHTPDSPLADGAHTFRIRVTDAAGNVGSATKAFTVDTAAPSGPELTSTVPASPANANSPKIVGSAASGSTVRLYVGVDCSGSPIATTSAAQLADGVTVSVPDDSTTKFTATSTSSAENTSACSAPITYVEDSSAPQTSIDGHPDDLVAQQTAIFLFSATDPGGSGVASYECRRDSVQAIDWAPCTSATTYGSLADGSHKFEVRAVDHAGNVDTTPATYEWAIDTVGPEAQIDSHPSSPSASATADFAFSGNDTGGSGVASYQCRRDSNEASAWAPCTSPKTYTALSNGAHSFEVRAIDNAGNTGNAATSTWTIDTTAPLTQITKAPASLVPSASADFEFTGSDTGGSGIASYQCRRDSSQPGDWSACTSPKQYAGLSNGAHSFEVRAIDNAGNTGNAASATWTIDTTPPVATIDSGPSATTNNPSPTFTFHSSEPGSSFECSIDSGTPAYGPCSGPGASHTPASPLGDGSYTFRVRATDAASNPGAAATRSFTVDTAAPSAPDLTATAPASPANDNSPEIIGSALAGSTVRVYASDDCSGTAIATVSAAQLATGVTVSVVDDSTTRFSAAATSSAENPSPCSAPITYVEDSSSPTTLIEGHPAALNGQSTATFVFSGADTGGSGVASFQCRLDSTQEADWTPCNSPKTYLGLADGSHSFEARAIDAAGNVDATPGQFGWMIDTTSPQTQIDSHPASSSASSSASFAFSASDTGGSGVASFQCRLDSGQEADWAACTSPKSYSALAEGSHSFAVRAIDAAGNIDGSSASFSWGIDTSAPDTQIDSGPALQSASAAAEFHFSGNDGSGSGVSSYECRRDSSEPAAWTPCTSPKSYAALADGPHSFQVRAVDVAGNRDVSPATFSWTIDTTPPVATIDSGPSATTNNPTPTFTFHSSESGSSFECSIDNGTPAYGPCSGPGASHTPAGPLGDGSYTFRVRATDAAGNQGTAARSFGVDVNAPDAPELSSTIPASPANDNSPEVVGSAPAGSTVRIYSGADCSGAPLATDSAAQLAAGIDVSVPDDSTTELRATAKSPAENTSACSDAIAYVEDSTAPQTSIDGHPADLTDQTTATFVFSASDGSGSGISSYECRRDSSQALDWVPCGSPKAYESLEDGSHAFEVRATDAAGNVDATPDRFTWTIDTSSPDSSSNTPPETLALRVPVRLLRIVYNKRQGSARLIFRVPGPGTLTATSPATPLRKGASKALTQQAIWKRKAHQIKPKSVVAAHAGEVGLPIKLTAAGNKLLRERGRLKVEMRISFKPRGEAAVSRMLRITLKRKPPVRGRLSGR